MEDKVNYTLVGAFVLVLGAALVAGVLWLAVGLGGQKKLDPYGSVMNESVAGLSLDAPVKFLGVDVGKVKQIRIDPQNSRQVLLRFMIERGTPIKQDSEAVLKTQGLTGIAYVEISGGTEGSPPLLASAADPVPWIRSKPSLSARLENVLSGVLTGLDSLSSNLNAVLDTDNRAALKQTLAGLATVAQTLAAQQDAIRAGIQDAARTARLTAKAGEQLAPTLARISEGVTAISAGATAISAGASAVEVASTRAGVVMDKADKALTAADGGVQQLRTETLPELGRLISEMNQLATALRHLSEQTERQPSSLLVGGPTRPPGPGERIPR